MNLDPNDDSIREGTPPVSGRRFRHETRQHGRRLRPWFLIGLLILSVAGLVIVINYTHLLGWTPSNVERTLRRNLSVGSPLDQIEAFLDRSGWKHSYNDDPRWFESYSRGTGIKSDQIGAMIFAEIPNPKVGIWGLDSGRITVILFLDKNDLLLGHDVRESILSL